MNATQPSRPPLQPVEVRRRASQKKSHHRRPRPHRTIALEATAKLVVNVLLSAVAVSGIVQLLHYQQFQQERLREMQKEVNSTQERVTRLQVDFSRYFDPQQAKNIMQEQSNRVAVNQRQIILLDKTYTDASKK